tara:strand:- start:950 stop:1465 length:516 start_codon:yes stop_codon:yes gene_type:complete
MKKKQTKKPTTIKKAVKKKVVKKKVKKPVKKSFIDKIKSIFIKEESEKSRIVELRKKEKPFIRYSFVVESLKVDHKNLVEEILFEYKGTMVIPKSQKDNYKPGSSSVQGVHVIKDNTNDPVFKKDFNSITKQEVVKHLINNVRSGYVLDMRQTIKKELMPEYKIITKLPWK